MSFFHVDEKTLKDAIENQKRREEAAAAASAQEYDGHKLKFSLAVDGAVVIDSDPPLVSEVKKRTSE